MGNKKTPLLQALRAKGGTVYVFPSASEDIGLNIQSSTTGASLSHYALLNIPELTKEQLLCDYSINVPGFNGNNWYAMSLQNYMMNFETLISNSDDYNYQELSTVTEKVFWHWMNKIGAISFENDFVNIPKQDGTYRQKNFDKSKTVADNTVVKCFGSIDAGNVLSSTFGMFNETYINIPTSYGAGPVYFTFEGDSNYKLNSKYEVTSTDALEGRADGIYSSYTAYNDKPFTDNGTTDYIVPAKDGMTIVKDLTAINNAVKADYSTTADITSYDDLNVDITGKYGADELFDFNAILLYYSVYDQDDAVKTPYATNLFGIIFLDGSETISSTDSTSFHISTLSKQKSTAESFGNSYSFRVNMKSMSVYDNTDAVIQDNTTMSSIDSVDFSDVIANMNKAIDVLNGNTKVISTIQNNYAAILSYYDNQSETIKDISTALNAYIKGTRSSLIDTSLLKVNTIQTRNDKIDFAYIDEDHAETEVVASVSADGIDARNMTADKETHKDAYVDRIGWEGSLIESNSNELYIKNADDTVKRVFENGDLQIYLRSIDDSITNGIQNAVTPNQIYINPESPIFTDKDSPELSLNILKDSDGNINYEALIPLIIYQLQKNSNSTTTATTYNPVITGDYSSIKAMASKGELVIGKKYRITDYSTAVDSALSDTVSSAGHAFDIVLTADSATTFNENATAVLNNSDNTYFSSSNLSAWSIKYSINNDTDRFAWASSSGKGVIYYMKDEYENEAYYDFKNILFNGAYTFNASDNTDATLVKTTNNNKICAYINSGKFALNENTINVNGSLSGVTIGVNCYSNSLTAANDTANVVIDPGVNGKTLNIASNEHYVKLTDKTV